MDELKFRIKKDEEIVYRFRNLNESKSTPYNLIGYIFKELNRERKENNGEYRKNI